MTANSTPENQSTAAGTQDERGSGLSVASGSPALDSFWMEKGARFTELIHVGGTRPSGYGFISGGGLYGRTGLEQEEFFESLTLVAYVDGMLAVLGQSASDWLSDRINEETAKRQALANTSI